MKNTIAELHWTIIKEARYKINQLKAKSVHCMDTKTNQGRHVQYSKHWTSTVET